MSYVRWGQDGSDVYVYPGGNTERNYLVCCGCGLSDDSVRAPSTAVMVAHLREHVEEGHHVPDYVIPDLEADDAKNFQPRKATP